MDLRAVSALPSARPAGAPPPVADPRPTDRDTPERRTGGPSERRKSGPRTAERGARDTDGQPVRFVPPRGKGRRLPAPRSAESGQSRRSSGRRRRSIDEVNATLIAPPPVSPPARDPARWARFETLVTEAGVSRERLLEAFPTVDDIEDICHTADADLRACADTLIRALGVSREADAGPAAEPGTVRCAECRHFVRAANHPRLGRCGAGRGATAAGGWWDTQPRACGAFAAQST